jgi:amino acid transporter
MVYAFARDGGLPFSKTWAFVSKAHQTPSNAIWGLSVLAMVLALSVQVYSAVVSIAVIALYISYGLPIVARLYFRIKNSGSQNKDALGPWNLGKFSNFNAVIAIAWIFFITVDFILPPNQLAGIVVLGCLILLIVIWFVGAKKKFPGPPQINRLRN